MDKKITLRKNVWLKMFHFIIYLFVSLYYKKISPPPPCQESRGRGGGGGGRRPAADLF